MSYNGGKRVTVREIAEMAGVSSLTAFKALSGKPNVASATRRRVAWTAKRLGYLSGASMGGFPIRRTNTIGVVMADHLGAVVSPLLRGIEAAAGEFGYTPVLGGGQHHGLHETVRTLTDNMVDGLLLVSPLTFGQDEIRLLKSTGLPYILAMQSHADAAITSVRYNNYATSFAMADYLVRAGGRRFLLLAQESRYPGADEQARGWLDALSAHCVRTARDDLLRLAPRVDTGGGVVTELLDRGFAWDTVVCGSDSLAIGAIAALAGRGVEVPGQVRVSGHDDIPLAAHLRIPLTTVRQPLYGIGEKCVNLLLEMLVNPDAPAQQISYNGQLVVRGTA